MHYGGQYPKNTHITTGPLSFSTDFSQDFHTFSLEWENSEMRYYVDDIETWKVNLDRYVILVGGVSGVIFYVRNWCSTSTGCPYTGNKQPWDKRFHFILNLAVGGMFFDGG